MELANFKLENRLEIEPVKMTGWKNEPTLNNLKQDYEDSRQHHEVQVRKINEWMDNFNGTGKAAVKPAPGHSGVVPKLIRKQAEWRYPALTEPFLSTPDLFKVKPVTWDDKARAEQNQLLLNNQFNTKLGKVAFIDEYVRTAVDEGTVIVKVGWDNREEEYLAEEPNVEFVPDPMAAQTLAELQQLQASDPGRYQSETSEEWQSALKMSVASGTPHRPVITGWEKRAKTRTLLNQPTVEVCDSRNVIIDPTCKWDLSKAGFIIHRYESSLSILKADGRYKNLEKIQIDNNSILGEPDHATNTGTQTFNFSDQARKKFIVYEYWGYWDIDGTGLVKPIVAAWVGSICIRMEENPFPDKALPFVIKQYLPVRRNTHGEPDGALLEDNQKIAGAVTRGMIDILGRAANGQVGMRKDALDANNRRKFVNGEDFEFNPGVAPQEVFHMFTYPEIPQSAQFVLMQQNMEAEAITGVKAFSQGLGSQSLGDVAAGIRGALDAASKRELGLLRRLSEGVVEIGRKILAMNAVFLSEEEVVRITEEQFVTVRRDDLPGNFDLVLSISTAEEDNNKAEQLAFMLQTTGNNMDGEFTRMVLAEIAKLRKMPDLAHRILEFQPQPDPTQQRLMELEMALKEAQLAKEQAQTQAYIARAELDRANIPLASAKKENLDADTDQKNLDFVEQESGVKQERDLQKQGEQARSQAQLKVLDNEHKKEQIKAKPAGK